jgi:sugar lactone lactonase YvrE
VGVGTVTDVVPPPKVLPNSVVRIDPKTLKPVQVVPVGDDPDLVVDAGGYIWVTHHMLSDVSGPTIINTGDRTLTRVDPSTGKAKQVGGGLAPCGLSAGPPGGVLVANCFPRSSGQTATIVRVDAKTLELKSWPVPGGHGFFRGVGYGGGWVWTDGVDNNRSSVIRINPHTGAQQSIHLPHPPGAFAWDPARGDLWTNNDYPGSFTRLHAKNGASSVIDTVRSDPVFPAVAENTVWAADWDSPQVVRVAITGSRTPRSIRLPVNDPYDGVWNVAAGAGYIWATTPRAGALWRTNPHTDAVTRIAMPYLPTMVTANASGVWVTVRGK